MSTQPIGCSDVPRRRVVDAGREEQAAETPEHGERAERRQHREPGERLVGPEHRPRALGDLPRHLESTHATSIDDGRVRDEVSRRQNRSGVRSVTLASSPRLPRPGTRQPHGRPHRLQRRLRPAAGDRPRLHGPGQPAEHDRRAVHAVVGAARRAGRRRRSTARTEPADGRAAVGALRRRASSARSSSAGVAVAPADLHVDTTVPVGSGLSSSSALAVALTLALGGDALDRSRRRRALASAAPRRRDRRARWADGPARVAVRTGRARAADRLPRPRPSRRSRSRRRIAVLVVHCGVPRTLAGSEYAIATSRVRGGRGLARTRRRCATRRPSRCATRRVRVTSSPRTRACSPPPTRSRAVTCRCSAHCCSRATPACATTSACRRPSSTRWSTCSSTSGAAGARLTGAGFGGCVVALAQRNHADDVLAKATLRYRAATGIDADGLRRPRRRRREADRLRRRPHMRPSSSAFLASNSAVGDVALVAQARPAARSARARRSPGCAGDTTAGACCTIATGMLRASIWR